MLQGPNANELYDLSENFDVETVALSDGYPIGHAELEREGKVSHSFDEGPERTQPKPARR